MMKKVPVPNLEVGMYVSQLDRPWLETPFLFQGFYINSTSDIDTLKKFCVYVYVDTERKPRDADTYQMLAGSKPVSGKPESRGLPKRQREYVDEVPVEEEISFARKCRESLVRHLDVILDDANNGKVIDVQRIEKSINDMVSSIVRNPDAFLWLSKLKEKDNYAYNHSIDTSVLAVSFGRHLGMNTNELHDLATGVLLCDIGKVMIPKELLNKPGRLTLEEFELIKTHVDHSVEILNQADGNVSREVVKIARFHHERHNGSGYPQGLKGLQIPVFARIAAIVDCYDAITTNRSYNHALPELEAIKCMYEWRDVDFQKELIEEFIQCLGVFPTGSIVELTTGEIGIVISQNRIRRLRPRVMLVLNAEKTSLGHFPVIDLATEQHDADGNPLEILRSHEAGVFGINPADFFI